MFWLNSDLAGLVLGLLVFLVMALVGWITHVPFWTAVQRALLGLIVGYVVGYFISLRVRKALTTMMVRDRLEKSRPAKERASAELDLSEPSEETGDDDDFAELR